MVSSVVPEATREASERTEEAGAGAEADKEEDEEPWLLAAYPRRDRDVDEEEAASGCCCW